MFVDWFGAVGSIMAGVAAAIAAWIAKNTLAQSRKDQKDALDRQKKQATLDAYAKLQDDVLDQLNRYTPSEIKKITEDNRSADYKTLGGYLARIEHFCVGLETDIYDYDTFYKLAHGYFDNRTGMLRLRLEPIIEKKLERSDYDFFENLHAVWKKMEQMTEQSSHV